MSICSRIDLGAVAVDDLDIAAGDQPLGLAVVFDALGDQAIAAIVDLHAADGGHRLVVVVVDQRVGLQQHLRAGRNLGAMSLDVLRKRRQRNGAGKKARQGGRAIEARQTGLPAARCNHDSPLAVFLV